MNEGETRRNPCQVWDVTQDFDARTWYRVQTDNFEMIARSEEGRWEWVSDGQRARVWRCRKCKKREKLNKEILCKSKLEKS